VHFLLMTFCAGASCAMATTSGAGYSSGTVNTAATSADTAISRRAPSTNTIIPDFIAFTVLFRKALRTNRIAIDVDKSAWVIPPFLTGLVSRIHAAIFSFCAGVTPPMPILAPES
ncbi:hypothetical protein WKW50_25045, partial [Ochrobactrum sp. GPK 3]